MDAEPTKSASHLLREGEKTESSMFYDLDDHRSGRAGLRAAGCGLARSRPLPTAFRSAPLAEAGRQALENRGVRTHIDDLERAAHAWLSWMATPGTTSLTDASPPEVPEERPPWSNRRRDNSLSTASEVVRSATSYSGVCDLLSWEMIECRTFSH